MSAWVALVIAVLANASSNFAFRRAAQDLDRTGPIQFVLSVLANPFFWGGAVLAGILLLCFLFAIREIPLPIAYAAVTAGSLSIITAVSFALGHAQPSVATIVGIGSVVFGMAILTASTRSASSSEGPEVPPAEVPSQP